MPILDDQNLAPSNDVLRLGTNTYSLLTSDNPFQGPLDEQEQEGISGPTPGFNRVWTAYSATNIFGELASYFTKPRFPRDPEFNSFRHIRETPNLRDDPRVLRMVELGVFDESRSEQEFMVDMVYAQEYFEHVDVMGRATTAQTAAAFAGQLIGDPTNFVPVGAAYKLAQGAKLSRRVAQFSGATAAFSLADEVARNQINPASNTPGASNELFSLGAGAAFGAVIGAATSPGAIGLAQRFADSRKLNKTRKESAAELFGPGAAKRFDPNVHTAFEVDAIESLADIPKEYLQGSYGESTKELQSLLDAADDDLYGVITVQPLRGIGDANDKLLDKLRKRVSKLARERGDDVSLNVVEHPRQALYDQWLAVNDLLNHPDAAADAPRGAFNENWLSRSIEEMSRYYAGAQQKVTPGGRLADLHVSRITEAWRALSGSARTVSKGAAEDPAGFDIGASADGLRSIISAESELTIHRIDKIIRKHRRERADFDKSGFYDRLGSYARAKESEARGYQSPTPLANTDPAIVEAYGEMRRYFDDMRQRMEDTGLLPGQKDIDDLEAQIAEVQADEASFLKRTPEGEEPQLNARAANKIARLQERAEDIRRAMKTYDSYAPIHYRVDRIVSRPTEFKERVVSGLRKRDRLQDGVLVSETEIPIRADIWEEIRPEEPVPQGAVLSDLADDLREAYLSRRDAMHRRIADDLYDTLTNPNNPMGEAEGARANPLLARTLDLDHNVLGEFVEYNAAAMIERYRRTVGGRIAVAESIRSNPRLRGQTLADGTPVTDGKTLEKWLDEPIQSWLELARLTDEANGRTRTDRSSLQRQVESLQRRVREDIGISLAEMEGRYPIQGQNSWAGWAGRNLLRLSFANKLGSVVWAQINDLAPITVHLTQRPQALRLLRGSIGEVGKMSRRDQEMLGLAIDGLARTRAISDTDVDPAMLGAGSGVSRAVSGAVERGAIATADTIGRVSLINWWTRQNKAVAASFEGDRLLQDSKRLLRVGYDTSPASLRKAGLSKFRAAKTSNMGMNRARAERIHRQVYEYGVLADGKRVRDVMSYDEYLNSKKPVNWNIGEWDISGNQQIRDDWRVVSSQINAEVNRSIVVTPSAFDQPNINRKYILGKLFNQFQTFGMAFVNQRLRVMAQMPAHYNLWYVMSYIALGALSDAISNHLSGRRSLNETAELWASNPAGMSYQAWNRSGLSGWAGRPLTLLDQLGAPFSPGVLFDNTVTSTSAGYADPKRVLSFAGPFGSDIERVSRVTADLLRLNATTGTAYDAWKLIPGQNLVWLRLLGQSTGLPVTPESILEERDEPPRP